MRKIITTILITILGGYFFIACGSTPVTVTQEVSEDVIPTTLEETTQLNMEQTTTDSDEILTITDVNNSEEEELQSTVNQYGDKEVNNYFDKVTTVKVIETEKDRYFIGRDNYEDNIGFFNQYLTEDSGKLYINKKMYLPDIIPEDTYYVSSSDENIALIEGNALIGKKQGTFTLSCYDKDMNVISEKLYVVSTYNDSREDIATHFSMKTKSNNSNYMTMDMRDVEYCKEAVSTIADMSYLLQMRHFVYDFSKEPDFGALIYNVSDEERWNWTASAQAIFDMNGGVCIQVAQLATYMLADDFEDWGVVMIEGRQGHIFNWFFVDDKSYVFDYTQVISDNCNRDTTTYKDYSMFVKEFSDIESFKNWCITSKVDITQNYAVFMYSCQGHDFIPTNINSVMSDSWGVVDGEKDEVLLIYQESVIDNMEVFFLMDGSNAEFVGVPDSEVPEEIPYGVFGRGELEYFYDYSAE